MMRRFAGGGAAAALFTLLAAVLGEGARRDDPALYVGCGEADITPDVGRPVYLAGFGRNRPATGIHDHLFVRAVVLRHGKTKIALAAADVVGLFYDDVCAVRKELPGFSYVLLSSTHTHSGPDTLGLWGPTPFKTGVDPTYLARLRTQAVTAIRNAEAAARPVSAWIGTARAPELLHDGREPYVKADELVAVLFRDEADHRDVGLLVQWNCHPETLGARNQLVSSDFVGPTVDSLRDSHHCPVVYFSGALGGLMTSMHVAVPGADGKALREDSMEKTIAYGQLVARLSERALAASRKARLTPLGHDSRQIQLPVRNPLFNMARQMGVLQRPAFEWKAKDRGGLPVQTGKPDASVCLHSEVAKLRFGELEIASIPGEIYPELVLGKVQDPADPGADYPAAPVEPSLYSAMPSRYRMVIGLANDEIGYILPKRQWDERPPFCYGRKKPQYGEQNSLGPDTAPLVCAAFQALRPR